MIGSNTHWTEFVSELPSPMKLCSRHTVLISTRTPQTASWLQLHKSWI